MVNRHTIYKIIGSLLFLETVLLLLCFGVACIYDEDDTMAFAVAALVCAGAGFVMRYLGRGSDNTMSRRDAYLVVSLTWVVFSLFGTLPFLVGGYISGFTDAFFEAMAGFTTTGASVIDDVEAMPHGILFWRSLMQWIGGLGIVFFTIALLPSLVGGSVKVFAAEATGPIKMKLHPRLSTNSKWIWVVYTLITLACFGSLYLAGMELFTSVNYAMCTAATGGFSTLNNAVSFSPLIQYILTLFCFAAGISFTLLYFSVSRFNLRRLMKNAEFRLYIAVVVACTLFIAAVLILSNGYDVEHAVRDALFQVVSFITTTGLMVDGSGAWPVYVWMVLAACMVLGGCAGSTAGGIKCIRGVMMLKAIRNEFRQILHPNAVLPMKIDGGNVPTNKRLTLLAFVAIYILLFLVGTAVITALGTDIVPSITITLSCLGNVGPTLGQEIGSGMTWSMLPDATKWLCMALMLVGRLEIFSVLVAFTPAFWKEN